MRNSEQPTWRDRIIRCDGPTLYSVAGAVIVVVLVGLWVLLASPTKQQPVVAVDDEGMYGGLRHPLTGARVDEPTKPAVYAVVIENSLDARPQDGVDRALMVMEAPVEGDITRWLAFFSADEIVEEIGPVRSARPYFVDWATDWDALFAHVGGSSESLALIRSKGTLNLDEFFNTATFWRSKRRVAPHNVYTESKRLEDAWERVVGREVDYKGFEFEEMDPTTVEPTVITVSYGNRYYDVEWKYDPTTNRYSRFHNGSAHIMRNGSSIEVSNVIVMFTDIRVLDDEGRKKIRTTGEGEALVMRAGEAVEATWKRDGLNERTHFVLISGDEAALVPGKTWIHVVPIGAEVTK